MTKGRNRPRGPLFLQVGGKMMLRKGGVTLAISGIRRMKFRAGIGMRIIRLGVAVMGCHVRRFKVDYER